MKRTTRRGRQEAVADDWSCALVTGASSGIGEALAVQLAAAGVDVVLVGRDADRLELVAKAVRDCGARAEVIVADLAEDSDVERVEVRLRDGEPTIDLLINNAGIGQYGRFVDLPVQGATDVLRVNTEALVRLTSAFLARAVGTRRGTIVQISSTASASPNPYQAVYAASKAFVTSFGQALAQELEGTEITCTTVLPGRTRTRYFERTGAPVNVPESQWMSADDVASAVISAARRRAHLVVPGRANRMHVSLATLLPTLPAGRVLVWMHSGVYTAARARRGARRVIDGVRIRLRSGG